MAGLGDLDGDGVRELALGRDGSAPGAFLFTSLGRGTWELADASLKFSSEELEDGDSLGDGLGSGLAAVGDVDGALELVVGA